MTCFFLKMGVGRIEERLGHPSCIAMTMEDCNHFEYPHP